jgi:hypothetical protein
MSAIKVPQLKSAELQAIAGIGMLIILIFVLKKMSDAFGAVGGAVGGAVNAVGGAIGQTVEGTKNKIKTVLGTKDQVNDIIKWWFANPLKNPFNPKYVESNPSKSYLLSSDVERIAKALGQNIKDGREVTRLLKMAKNKAQISQLAKSYARQYKTPLYKSIVDNLDHYNILTAYIKGDINNIMKNGIILSKYEQPLLDVEYFHNIVYYVNSLPS